MHIGLIVFNSLRDGDRAQDPKTSRSETESAIWSKVILLY